MNELALFAGAGGGILGGHLLGWRTVCAVEWEPYPASVLLARQNDGILPPFPIWDDVQTFDGKPWRGIVDVVSGGFPCQDISAAGKGDGLDGERSGMWKEMARIIGEVRPQYAFIENSPMLTTRGLERVLADLAQMGFDAEWGVLSAADVGANHKRERIWIVAHSRCKLWEKGNTTKLDSKTQIRTYGSIHNKSSSQGQFSNSSSIGLQGQGKYEQSSNTTQSKNGQTIEPKYGRSSDFWKIEPNVGRVADGVALGMDRLKAIGNGQVPLCAATAWKLLTERLENGN
jgi:DNA (cytosine-5)-methyltransferase 1